MRVLTRAVTSSQRTRIPSLDGLRAISIGLVLALHMSDSTNFVPYSWVEPFNPGHTGVWVFFVISGFLITSLLLNELRTTGRIDLKEFYFRRTLRIFPPMYAYIAVLAVLSSLAVIELQAGDLLRALTYTVNYHNVGGSWFVAHLWSLSVEEQFYLLWPAVLCFGGRQKAMKAALAVVLGAPVIRFLLWVAVPEYRINIGHTFETVADALAMGCLLAGFRDELWQRGWYRRLLTSRWFALMPFFAAGMYMLYVRPRFSVLIAEPLGNLAVALCIDWAVRFPERAVGRFLNWRPLIAVGVLSYSLYVWQQLFLQQYRQPGQWWATFPVSLLLALITAVASYFLIEQPALRLRHLLSRRRAPAPRPEPVSTR